MFPTIGPCEQMIAGCEDSFVKTWVSVNRDVCVEVYITSWLIDLVYCRITFCITELIPCVDEPVKYTDPVPYLKPLPTAFTWLSQSPCTSITLHRVTYQLFRHLLLIRFQRRSGSLREDKKFSEPPSTVRFLQTAPELVIYGAWAVIGIVINGDSRHFAIGPVPAVKPIVIGQAGPKSRSARRYCYCCTATDICSTRLQPPLVRGCR